MTVDAIARESARESRGRTRAGFTLVEILVVVAIISVLAGLVTVSVRYARKLANLKTTRIEIQHLEQAALSYKNAYGDYPPSSLATAFRVKTNGINDGNESLILHLSGRRKGGPFHEDFPDDRLENRDGDRLDPKARALIKKELDPAWNTAELFEYCDLWGNPYVYIHHRDYAARKIAYEGRDRKRVFVAAAKSAKTGTYHRPTTFQIWSFGPNGVNENGAGDDITSWTD